MHAKRLATIVALVVIVAVIGAACYAAAPVKPAKAAKPAAAATGTPTMEKNLVKFKASPDSSVVAVVYGQNITKSELNAVLWDWMAPSTLDQYINYKVVMTAMKKRGLSITAAEMKQRIDDAKKGLPPGETIERMTQKVGLPMAQLKARLTMQAGLEKIIEHDNAPTAAEYAEYIRARHILIKPATLAADAKEEDKAKADADAKAKAEKILAEIKSGAKTFEQAAKEYSEDAGGKINGGDLDWFTKRMMVPEFSEAAFKMKPGEISGPVKSTFGYHIIRVDKVGSQVTGADKAALKKKIMAGKVGSLMDATFKKIKDEAKIDNKIAPTLPEIKQPQPMGGPTMMPSPGGQ